MSKLMQAQVSIVGTRPFLFHVFSTAILDGTKKEKHGSAGNNPDEWKTTYLATAEGQLYVRPDYVLGAMITAAKSYKVRGRTTYMNTVASVVRVLNNQILFDRWMPEEITDDPTQPVYLDIRSVVNPSTRGRNVRYRVAMSTEWQTNFTLEWDASEIGKNIIEPILIDAGRMIGIGDGRTRLGMGRFDIVAFSILE